MFQEICLVLKKKGAGFNYRFDNLNRIKRRMSKKSFDSFYNYYINNKRNILKVIKAWIRYLWHTKTVYLNYFLKKIGISIKSKPLTADCFSNPGAPSYLFNWGVDEMIKRYSEADIEKWWKNNSY